MDVSGIRYAELSQSHRALQNKLNQLEKEKNSLQNVRYYYLLLSCLLLDFY